MTDGVDHDQHLVDRVWKLSEILWIAKKIHSSLDVDQVLASFVDLALGELGARAGHIDLVDRKTGGLEVRHAPSGGSMAPQMDDAAREVAERVAATGQFEVVEGSASAGGNLVALPLKDIEGDVIGVLQLFDKPGDGFGEDDVSFLTELVHFLALAIKNAQYHKDSVAKARVDQELKVATLIQGKLVPRERPRLPGFEVTGSFTPCYETAGDYYHFFEGQGQVTLALVDVSGKGVGAAIVASSIHTFLARPLRAGGPLAQIAAELSEFLIETYEAEKYATGVLVRVEEAGAIRYVSAGHTSMILARNPGPELLASTGPPFGLLPGACYEEATFAMDEGDLLCGYSDGFEEAQNPQEEEFGIERLTQALRQERTAPLDRIVTHIVDSVTRFQAGTPDRDDKTLVLLRRC